MGGGRCIVDCSKPNDLSVNNFTEEIAETVSYNSVDSVINIMEKDDFLTTLDISEAYIERSPIHRKDRTRQGICWQFSNYSSNITYMVDNRLCMGLFR